MDLLCSSGTPRKYVMILLSAIVSLLQSSRPAAIPGTVISVRINPVYRQTIRRLSHVFQKISKILPPFAHLNSQTTVDPISFVFGIFASLMHSGPAAIRFRHHLLSSPALGVTMGLGEFPSNLLKPAAAAFAFVGSEALCHDRSLSSTLTDAQIPKSSAAIWIFTYNLPSAYLMTIQEHREYVP